MSDAPDWSTITNEALRIRLGGNLSGRAINVLRTLGVHDVDGLLALSMERLTEAKNCGARTLREIKEAIEGHRCPLDPEELAEIRRVVRQTSERKGESVAWAYARKLLAELDRRAREGR